MKDISRLLRAGPFACDAALAFSIRTGTSVGVPPGPTRAIWTVGSSRPIGFAALYSLRARPSQKLR